MTGTVTKSGILNSIKTGETSRRKGTVIYETANTTWIMCVLPLQMLNVFGLELTLVEQWLNVKHIFKKHFFCEPKPEYKAAFRTHQVNPQSAPQSAWNFSAPEAHMLPLRSRKCTTTVSRRQTLK